MNDKKSEINFEDETESEDDETNETNPLKDWHNKLGNIL